MEKEYEIAKDSLINVRIMVQFLRLFQQTSITSLLPLLRTSSQLESTGPAAAAGWILRSVPDSDKQLIIVTIKIVFYITNSQ